MKNVEDKVKNKVQKFHEMERKLVLLESSLSKNKEFKEFLKLQKAVDETANGVWAEIEKLMIESGKKSIDAEWVLLTIVEKKNLKVDEDKLADEFTVSKPDTKKINAYIKEKKRPPKGVEVVDAPYLRKTFRQFIS